MFKYCSLICVALAVMVGIIWQNNPVQANGNIITLQGYTISFLGVDNNYAANQSTWRYHVSGLSDNSGPDVKDLSYLQFALCASANQTLWAASHDGFQESDSIKFERLNVQKDDSVGVDLWFTLEGIWDVDLEYSINLKLKAGPDVYSGSIAGPACRRSCQVEWTVNHRTDWRLLKPGVYVAEAMIINVRSQVDVQLLFTDFTHLYHPDDPNTTPIQVEYSIGETLEEADAFGWRPAGETIPVGFNETVIDIPASQAQLGVQITVWNKMDVVACNKPDNYIGVGKVTIKPACEVYP